MTQETWLGLGMGFLIAAGLVLIGMVLSWLEERERKKRAPVVEERTQLVAMPGMDEPRTQPLPVFDEVCAATFLDEVALMPESVEPELPGAEELRRRIDEALALVEGEEVDE